MWKSIFATFILGIGALGCAAPQVKPEISGAPAEVREPEAISPQGSSAVIEVSGRVVEKVISGRAAKTAKAETEARTITIECVVKLPDDPTDNPELCRSFQMTMLDETGGEVIRFRFAANARYHFAGKAGKKYRLQPQLGSNWEFSVEPNTELEVGKRTRVQFRQKE